MDLATIVGLVIAVISLLGAFYLEASPIGETLNHLFPVYPFSMLFSVTAMMIVFGGTIAAMLVSFPLEIVINAPKAILKAFLFKDDSDFIGTVDTFVRLSEKARREGLLSLEEEEAALNDTFLKKGIGLVVDGQDPELIRSVLEIDIEQMEHRHEEGVKVLEAGGGFAPTMGIIGTVMGLISVLSNLSDTASLGGHVAVAFVATLYGVSSANLFWLPLANKLKTRSKVEVTQREMMIEGILAVQAGENPRIIGEKLEGFLSPSMRRARAAASGQGEPAAAAAR